MQVYRGLDIGTAKPTEEEQALVPHHLIDVCEVGEVFDAKKFIESPHRRSTEIHSRGEIGARGRRNRPSTCAPCATDIRGSIAKCGVARAAGENERGSVIRRTGAPGSGHGKDASIAITHAVSCAPWKSSTKPASRSANCKGSGDERRPIAPHTGGNHVTPRAAKIFMSALSGESTKQIGAGWLDEVRRLRENGLEKNPTAMQAAGHRELLAHLRGVISHSRKRWR